MKLAGVVAVVVGMFVTAGSASAQSCGADQPYPGSGGDYGNTYTGCHVPDSSGGGLIVGCSQTSDIGTSTSLCGVVPVYPTTSPRAACGTVTQGGSFGRTESTECQTTVVAGNAAVLAWCAKTESSGISGRSAATGCEAFVAAGPAQLGAGCEASRSDHITGETRGFTGCRANDVRCGLASSQPTSQATPFPGMPTPQRIECGDVVAPAAKRALELPRRR